MIRLLQMQDYNTWINLAKEVEYLFGPMVDSKDFQDGIKNCLENNKVNEGRSARSIYERSGFVDLKDAGKKLAGIETVIMVYRTDK